MIAEQFQERIRNRPKLPPVVDETKTQDVLKWAAGGFAALVALLAFFGVKEGVLARVVHQNSIAAVAVLVLVGFGALLALAAPLAKAEAQMPWAALLLVALLLLVFTEWVSGNVPNPLSQQLDGVKWIAIVITVLVAFCCLVFRTTLSLGFGLAVLAVCSTNSGLYAAAKVAILDDLAGGAVSVGATFTQSEHALTLTADATGQASYGPTRLAVRALDDDGKPLPSPGGATFLPDQAGVLKGSVSVIVPSAARTIVVLTCHQGDAGGPPCTPSDEQVHLVVPGPAARLGSVITATADGDLSYTVSGSGLQSLASVEVEVGPAGGPPISRSHATPSTGGELSVTGTVKIPTPAQPIIVSVRRCALDGACDAARELARYQSR